MKEHPIIFTGHSVRAILAGTKSQTRRLVRWKLREAGLNLGFTGLECGLYNVVDPASGYVLRSRDGNSCWNDRTWPAHPLGAVGSRLWVKETWCRASDDAILEEDPQATDGRPRGPIDPDLERRPFAFYRATDPHVVNAADEDRSPWKSPIFMPRWASRIALEITDVRVERLQSITEEDARAEGIAFDGRWFLGADHPIKETPKVFPTARQAYESLWDSINGKRRRREEIPVGDPDHGIGGRTWRTVIDESARWEADPWVWCIGFKRIEAP